MAYANGKRDPYVRIYLTHSYWQIISDIHSASKRQTLHDAILHINSTRNASFTSIPIYRKMRTTFSNEGKQEIYIRISVQYIGLVDECVMVEFLFVMLHLSLFFRTLSWFCNFRAFYQFYNFLSNPVFCLFCLFYLIIMQSIK